MNKRFPLSPIMLCFSMLLFGISTTNIQAQEAKRVQFTYKLTLTDFVKGDLYTANSPTNENANWNLIRKNRLQPTKGDQHKFKKKLGDFNELISVTQLGNIPETIRCEQKDYSLEYKETNNSGEINKVVYKRTDGNSLAHQISVFYTYSYYNTAVVEKITKTTINLRNGQEDSQYLLSFFDYSR